MNLSLLGTITMGFALAGLFFLRFWRQTHDRLFILFAVSFWVEAVNRATFAFIARPNEDRPLFFLARLLAYGLLLAGIVTKNLPPRR